MMLFYLSFFLHLEAFYIDLVEKYFYLINFLSNKRNISIAWIKKHFPILNNKTNKKNVYVKLKLENSWFHEPLK